MVTDRFEQAEHVIPGGVNSPVRAFASVGGRPVFMHAGGGAYLVDENQKRYIDYVMSWGPLILGHAHPAVVEAIAESASTGQSLGTATPQEVELAETIVRLVPTIDKVRLVNSGTEATMSALRLARAFTERKRFVKFVGSYHGHGDSFLIEAGSGALSLGVPSSPGVPEELASMTLVAEYNDLSSVERLFEEHGQDIAAVFVEPVCGNMGCVLPQAGFLSGLRELTERHGALLVFDEVITGFRLAPGGAQAYFGVEPDLTCLGKILGGGLPVGAYGGRAQIMSKVAPEGPVYQAGTLSGGRIVTSAALATLQAIQEPGFHETLEERTNQLVTGLEDAAEKASVPVVINHIASMLTVFFSDVPVFNFRDVCASRKERFATFFHTMLAEGIYLPPSPFECWFVSAAHTTSQVEQTVEAAARSFAKVAAAT
jgi:glutamate-1-semialdehyde 2,1-aminomutase